MVNKQTKGYTKSIISKMNFAELNAILKNPNEPLDKWIIRKSEEAIYGGTDERDMSRKGDVQNPNPPFKKK